MPKNKTQFIIEKNSEKPGPVSVVIAGIHGNEVCGIKAIDELLPKLKIKAGKVYFIYANQKAIAQKTRQIDTNLNRLFIDKEKLNSKQKKSYEFNLRNKIIKYLNEGQALLDIHSTNNKTIPFVIGTKQEKKIARQLPFSIFSTGWDKIEPGSTEYYMHSKNKIGLSIECGQHKDPQAITIAKKSIINFLSAVGNIKKNKLPNKKQKIINVNYIYHTKTNKFKLIKTFDNFAKIKKAK